MPPFLRRPRPFTGLVLSVWLFLLGGTHLPGQAQQASPLADTVFTLGTVARDPQGRDWAFLALQPTDASLLAERKLAIHRKEGAAGSAAPYERRAILGLQTAPGTLRILLERAALLGDNLTDLEGRLEALFAGLIPQPSWLLEDKLSAVLRGAVGDPVHFDNLVQLGRLHPGVGLALGFAHAERIPAGGVVTFEVRDFDFAANQDRGVLGRVTVQAGQPQILPAPGPLFEVRDASGKGHLNAKLRWATSPDFRRLSLLSYGFNLYRVDPAYAEHASRQFHLQPPGPGQLQTLASLTNAVVAVNEVPLLPGSLLDNSAANLPESVFNPSNPTAFVADDNGLARGGFPFQPGDRHYYFVHGRDLLGRDGIASPALLVTICDRIPPRSPRMPVVENHYDFVGNTPQQRLKVTWRPVEDPEEDSGIAGYYVYRWRAPGEIARFEGTPAVSRISALIPHVPGQASYSFIDSGGGAPSVPTDLDKTFWYTVRAVDTAECDGGNLSANSPPAFGVLRDREAPAGPVGGGPWILCCTPTLEARKPETRPSEAPPDPENDHFELAGVRRDDGIAWIQFWISLDGGQTQTPVGRFEFPPRASEVIHRWSLPQRLISENFLVVIHAEAGDHQGNVTTRELVRDSTRPDRQTVRRHAFDTRSQCERIAYDEKSRRMGCAGHHPRPPQPPDGPDDEESIGVVVQLPLQPGTREFRLYRRVDFGPLTLVRQGRTTYHSVTNLTAEIPDNDLPIHSGVLCYYGQLLDEHGNASPLVQLGLCLPLFRPTARPMLSPLEASLTPAGARMTIRWFCPPAGIERFEIHLGIVGEAPPTLLGDVLSTNQAPAMNLSPVNPNSLPIFWKFADFGHYLTPQVGVNFGDGASFAVTVPSAPGKTYRVRVRPITRSGSPGALSNTEVFEWTVPPEAAGPKVPWPARPLPVPGTFHPLLQPVRIHDPEYNGVGIRIATFRREEVFPTKDGQTELILLRGQVNPLSYVFTNAYKQTLFPAALYRYQIPNDTFSKVSGDVVQVSPLMEVIARSTFTVPGGIVTTRIHDPFIHISSSAESGNTAPFAAMYLLDTQPMILGARYAYLLVRFDESGEVIQVVPTAALDVNPNPQ